MSATNDNPEDELGLEGPFHRLAQQGSGFVLTRFVMLRLLGLVYLAAFLTAALQLDVLIGPQGLVPSSTFVDILKVQQGGSVGAARVNPSLFVFIDASSGALTTVSWIGVALSVAVLLGATNAWLMGCLWLLYLSIVNIGGTFYGYGWESQLLETGLLAVFLCPLSSLRPFPKTPPSIFVIWAARWLIFRVMLGAGLIKLRGDDCWRDLTCLRYHYETQPIPGPLSPYFHALPAGVAKVGVAFNHLVELVAPVFAFGPKPARRIAGALFILFQIVLIFSGNLSFLNWLTMVPALACLDDDLLKRILPRQLVDWAQSSTSEMRPSTRALWVTGAYVVVVAFLSLSPIANMASSRQRMNEAYDPLRVVNTYGAFGSVTRERIEVVIQGSEADDPADESAWRDYDFPCKPTNVDEPLCWITPYHRRLDWQLWFLQFGPAERFPWFVNLMWKILNGDPVIRRAIEHDPFSGRAPKWVRAEMYRYRFSDHGHVWEREHVGNYMRPFTLGDKIVETYLERQHLLRR